MSEIADAIGSFGFPIVMCLLFWLSSRNDLKELQKAVDNNSKVIEKLIEHLDKDN